MSNMGVNNLEASVWGLGTEQNNQATMDIDQMNSVEIVEAFLSEDSKIVETIALEKDNIAKAIETIAESFKNGGRLFYFGAGTSGRLGVLDASECPPTFGTDPELVQGVIAGGDFALRNAVEAAEDNVEAGRIEIDKLGINSNDTVVGITASGRTPYVIGACARANEIGAETIAVVCNEGSELAEVVNNPISVVTGPELIQGSTRLKAGTATKMVLNMLTTGAMIRTGKVYGNRMVDMRPTNDKLKIRAVRLTMEITGLTKEEVIPALEACNYHVKPSVLCILGDVDAKTAEKLLEKNDGFLRNAIAEAKTL